jgi:pimeloyl-ACP methyl ester carboxylesterase
MNISAPSIHRPIGTALLMAVLMVGSVAYSLLPVAPLPQVDYPTTEPASLPGWVTEADVDVYVEAFTRSGFRGPLGWYRNFDRSWELMEAFAGAKVDVPAHYLAGERDFVVAVNWHYIADQPRFVPHLQPPIMLPDCGHGIEQERAPEVSAALINFLRHV